MLGAFYHTCKNWGQKKKEYSCAQDPVMALRKFQDEPRRSNTGHKLLAQQSPVGVREVHVEVVNPPSEVQELPSRKLHINTEKRPREGGVRTSILGKGYSKCES